MVYIYIYIANYEVREIVQLMDSIEYRILHTYGKRTIEGLILWLTVNGCKEGKTLQFSCFEDLPKEMRGIVKLDRRGMLNLRCKKF